MSSPGFRSRLRQQRQRREKSQRGFEEYERDTKPAEPGSSLKEKVISTMSPIDKLGVGLAIRWLKRRSREEAKMPILVDQTSVKPTRKVTAAAGGGVFAAIVIAVAGWFGVELGAEEAAVFAAALATFAGYFFKERA